MLGYWETMNRIVYETADIPVLYCNVVFEIQQLTAPKTELTFHKGHAITIR